MDLGTKSMTFKILLFRVALIAGIAIASFSALATYLIIGVPIGWKMITQIFLAIALLTPFIYMLSLYFSKKFSIVIADIQSSLLRITKEDFNITSPQSSVNEICKIHAMLNTLSNTLQNNLAQLKQQNHEQETMLYSIAHDFRTPLTVIKGYVEEIQDGIVPLNQTQEYFTSIQKEIDFLSSMIASLLSYLQAQHYSTLSSQQYIDAEHTISNYVLPLLNSRKRDNVIISVNIAPKMNISFNQADFIKIWLNLFDNALKFTSSGVIKLYQRDASFVLEDSGCGIEEENKHKIFEPFYTCDACRNLPTTGIGLGLSIVKTLLKKNGYTIIVDATYTAGARFILSPYMAP